ncbi:MAG: ATP-binding protein, partial [Candidatus Aminicenantes bacterium]|nr:ATP-binding protein [Candidatus Aminicenantes bacterium]
MNMKNLPIGIQSFGDLIRGNYLYIDKTREIYKFFKEKGKYYFLSRPRRFGKSLMISTLKEIFLGNKELFKDLYIYDKIEWKIFPVIHIDFLGLKYAAKDELIAALNYVVDQNAQMYDITLTEKSYEKRFRELVKILSRQNKVVVLVDEYDKPVIDLIDRPDAALMNRNILKTFYGNLKALDEYLEFVFITGVSKFSKISIFSDLNNLDDITIDDRYAAILGYTHDELLHYFADRIESILKNEGGSKTQLIDNIKTWYNGYSWDGKNFMYNPFSILNFFQKKKFGNYWFESGSPSFLVKLIRRHRVDIIELENYKAGETVFSSFDIDRMHVVSLLFQTGYLTIKNIELAIDKKRIYNLSYPNYEVKESLLENILGDFSMYYADKISVILSNLKESLVKNEMDRFFESIRSIFAHIPYNIFVEDREGYYHTVIYLILTLIGISIDAEIETNIGRIDAVVETTADIY